MDFYHKTLYFTIFGIIFVSILSLLVFTGIWGFPDFLNNVVYSNLVAGSVTLLIGLLVVWQIRKAFIKEYNDLSKAPIVKQIGDQAFIPIKSDRAPSPFRESNRTFYLTIIVFIIFIAMGLFTIYYTWNLGDPLAGIPIYILLAILFPMFIIVLRRMARERSVGKM